MNHTVKPNDISWPWWPLLPLYPYGKRRTLRRQIVPGQVWVFEQIQGIFYVITPIRMTVIHLETGGLLIYAPVAPTRECIQLLRELEAIHGAVKYIILPTTSGLEHKVFVGPFARRCPDASLYVAPNQWSFPVNLPLSWLGMPKHRTFVLPFNSADAPFSQDLDYAILPPINLNLGDFQEVAFLHRATKTLLVTDCLVSVPFEPPAVMQLDPFPLLFHAKDHAADPVRDTPENRRRGWHRIALFSFYFRSHALKVKGVWDTLKNMIQASDRSSKSYFGLYPFDWQSNWYASFSALRGEGRLFVAPILQTLILNRAPAETLAWAETLSHWDIEQVIPCHLDAPIAATGSEVLQAFSFLKKQPTLDGIKLQSLLPDDDIAFMKSLDEALKRRGITPPHQEKV